jgi:predicted nucleotidyltransferase
MAHSLSKTGSVQERIAEMVRRIVSQFNPEKVILFGSHARGEAGPDSVVDLLIVMAVEGAKRHKATEIDVALFGIDVPVDVIVVRPEEFERYRHQIGSIFYPALREGQTLYDRTA